MNNHMLTSLLLAATCCSLVSGQFMPQSHLGRLVQSITSPLMLASSGADSPDGYSSDPSNYYGGGDSAEADEPQRAPSARSPSAGHQLHQQPQMLQQEPSQHRAIPQHYYGGSGADSDERDHGPAPSNQKQAQDYQMGADLGPTLDDKELSGVFNSNDDRGDDEDAGASSGFDELGRGGSGGRAAASQQYPREGDGYGYGPAPTSGRPQAGYDEDSADEDDEGPVRPVQGRRGGRARPSGGLSQAASQYRQQGSANGGQQQQYQQQGPMMAAANGYAPYGYANGPVDLTGLMSGIGGDPSGQGYQAYNGDGSYPGANYYQQQGQPRGGRSQAESMNNGYQQNQGANQQRQNDNDEQDNDADED